MPLRQPPAEQPFSLIPPNWNPVSNDRVLLHFGPVNSGLNSGNSFPSLAIRVVRPVRLELLRPMRVCHRYPSSGQNGGFCHFDSDGFCRLTPILRYQRLLLFAFQKNLILFF